MLRLWSLTMCYGRYETVINEDEALQLPYNELAKMLNCSPSNVAILQSATAAWMQVCPYGLLLRNVLTSLFLHQTPDAYLQHTA